MSKKGLRVMTSLKTKDYKIPSIKNKKYWGLGKNGGFLWEQYGKDFEQFIEDLREDLENTKTLSINDPKNINDYVEECKQNCDIKIIDYVLEKLEAQNVE